MGYSVQLYSLHDMTGTDLYGALRAVAEMGYTGVEFAGFFGHSAETVRGWLDELGLVCTGTHTVHGEIMRDFDACVAFHRTIGCRDIIIPGFNYSTEALLDEFIHFCNTYAPRLAAEGIRLSFHNHSGEFLPTAYGKIVEDEILARTDITLQIDTFWAFKAGRDPVALMREHRDRLACIHVKDGLADGTGRPLGQGEAPVAAVVAAAKELGVPMVVESENLQPDGVTEVRTCLAYLNGLA